LQFGFVNFWNKDIGEKVAHDMLVKLAASGNFTNILQSAE
jgi:hypothetical protein